MPIWLTAAEIARRLGRPVSTIRSWRDRYRPFVPERRDTGGQQVYPLDLLAEIEALHSRRLTTREITQELQRRHVPSDESPPAAPPSPDRFDQVLAKLDEISEHVAWLVERERARSE